MNIIVTGGAGFIGSHIVDRLIELGHTVAVVDNLRSGKKENVNPKAVLHEVDVRDQQKLPEIFNTFKPEAVFHLAAQNEVPYSMEHPLEDQDMNIVGMINLLECARPLKSKIIYSNTGGAYYGEVPTDHIPIVEDEPVVKPTSFYGVSKAAAEQYLKLFGNIYGIPWVSLRYSNVYGPRQAGNREAGIVAIFTAKMLEGQAPMIHGDGGHTRDYVYVDDVADANIAALNYTENDYFNISTGTQVSNNEVFSTIESNLKTGLVAGHGPDRPGDARFNSLSPAKANQKLSWKAKTDFATGVHQTLAYYKKS